MDESPGKMYALATALSTLAIVAVVLRFYERRIKKMSPSWDDYLVVLALVRVPLGVYCTVLIVDLFHHTRNRFPLSGRQSVCLWVRFPR